MVDFEAKDARFFGAIADIIELPEDRDAGTVPEATVSPDYAAALELFWEREKNKANPRQRLRNPTYWIIII